MGNPRQTVQTKYSHNKKGRLMSDNVIDNVAIIITFSDGSKKTFGEDDVGEDFQDWLSDVNYDKKKEKE